MANKYPGKLLFFGEYTIIDGSLALALPYPYFSGTWKSKKNIEKIEDFNFSRDALKKLLDYLEQNQFANFLDLDVFRRDLDVGYWFDSNIPNGYGCGSSGAVCAAIYDRYAITKCSDVPQLQKALAMIEGYFHGQSSGVDPLVCYLNQAVLIQESGAKVVEVAEDYNGQLTFFLIDSKISRKTTPLVQHYKEQAKSSHFQEQCIQSLKHLNKKAIYQFLDADPALYSSWQNIARLEFEYFQFMIPDAFKAIWADGLEVEANYSLKLCGAGGGGYILGVTKDWRSTEKQLKQFELIRLE